MRRCDAQEDSPLDCRAMQNELQAEKDPAEILRRSIANDRVHSAFLFTGAGELPAETARQFARALVCRGGSTECCGVCNACVRSEETEEAEAIALDGKGKRGPTYRHIGDHPDLLWVERGVDDTRITIGQIRDIQSALRLGANEG